MARILQLLPVLLPVLLLLCVSLPASGSPLLGADVCSRGPGFWCKNAGTASRCRALEQCSRIYWAQPTAGDLPCDVCKESVGAVDELLKSNATEQEVAALLLRLCEAVSDEALRTQCQEMVKTELPALLATLEKALNPGVLCSSLGLCRSALMNRHGSDSVSSDAGDSVSSDAGDSVVPRGSLVDVASPFINNVPLLLYPQQARRNEGHSASSREPCEECVRFMSSARDQTPQGGYDPFTRHLVLQCQRLQPGARELCKSYAVAYAGQVADAVMNMTPEEACAHSGFCPKGPTLGTSKVTRLQLKALEGVKFGPTCVLCEFIMSKLDGYLADNRTERAVVDAVESVCSLLPSTTAGECRDFVDRYGTRVVDLLVKGLSPAVVCTLLGLCFGDAASTAADAGAVHGDCTLCKLLLSGVEVPLGSNVTTERAESALRAACDLLPLAYRGQCHSLLQENQAVLVAQLLGKFSGAERTCTAASLCSSPVDGRGPVGGRGPVDGRGAVGGRGPVGGRRCTWGPSFWCRDADTARACGATEYCQDKMWKSQS